MLQLAYEVIGKDPDITASELAHQLGVCRRTAYNYRKAVEAGALLPVDRVAVARRHLEQRPRATAAEIGALFGLKRDVGRRLLQAALADIEKNPTPAPAPAPRPALPLKIPKFSKLKEKP